ncbi:MAG: hypothetical protein V7765_21255 [Oleispira sp.]
MIKSSEFSVMADGFKIDTKGRKVQFMVILWDVIESGKKSFVVAVQKCVNGKEFGVCQKGKKFTDQRIAADYGYMTASERLSKIAS